MVPARGAPMMLCIFIASSTAICWPRCTVSPALTWISRITPGIGAPSAAAPPPRRAAGWARPRAAAGSARRRAAARGAAARGSAADRVAAGAGSTGVMLGLGQVLVPGQRDFVALLADHHLEAVGSQLLHVDDELATADTQPCSAS